MHFLTRRIFLGRASLASAGTLLSALDRSTADTPISWRAAIIGHTGQGLIVLGTHIFDMMRLFAGDALWCSAQVSCQGHAITRADSRDATKRIGPVAGDEIEAQFGFTHGITATFTSRGRNAMKAIEMVMAVYAAGLSRGRVTLPLQQRVHPLVS